jgi:hypothetical protein
MSRTTSDVLVERLPGSLKVTIKLVKQTIAR